jgi:hypothetical protein
MCCARYGGCGLGRVCKQVVEIWSPLIVVEMLPGVHNRVAGVCDVPQAEAGGVHV